MNKYTKRDQGELVTYKIGIFKRVCRKFGLGSLKCIKVKEKSPSNYYYKFITNQSKYFVKVYTIDKLKAIESTAKTELFFKKGGIPVLTRINTLNGNSYLIIEDSIYVVFPYIRIPKIKKWRKELYYEFGDFLGKMHKYSIGVCGKSKFKTFDLEKKRLVSLKAMYSLLDILHKKEQMNKQDKLTISNLMMKIRYLEDISCGKLTLSNKAIIHGDFHPGNLYIKDNKIRIIYDFDNHCVESIYYELAKVIVNTCFNGSFDAKKFIRTGYFLTGYKKHITLEQDFLRTAITICCFEFFSSLWLEKRLLTKVTDELTKNMKKETRTLDYFANGYNLNNFLERVCDLK